MARLWSCGFELQSATAGVEVDSATGATIVTTTKRSGSASLRCYRATSGVAGYSMRVTDSTSLYSRAYVNIKTSTSEFGAMNPTEYQDTTGYVVIGVSVNTNDTLQVGYFNALNNYVSAGSASSALSKDTWYRVEFYAKYNSASSVDYEFKLDGTTVSSGTVTVYNAGVTNFRIVQGGITYASTGECFLDDIAVNNTSGSAQTSWPGAGSIVHMQIDGNGDTQNQNAGDWDELDEVTPDDATSYIELDDDNDIAEFTCESSSNAGIGASDTITLVQVGVRHKAETAAAMSITPRIKGQASGTVAEGTNYTHNDTTWRTNGDALPRNYKLTSYVNPQDSAAWETGDLDTMQIGVKTPDATPDVWISTIWALVEYVPSAGSLVKTVNALARASVKTKNGLAIASVKTWDGLA